LISAQPGGWNETCHNPRVSLLVRLLVTVALVAGLTALAAVVVSTGADLPPPASEPTALH
jgi:hypothetical protein